MHTSVPLLAVAAAPAGNIERNRTEIALLDKLDVATELDDFARHLVPHDHSLGSREAAVIDMLVAPANVGRNDFENDPVLDFLPFGFWSLG
jgi:hypothetical protein